MQSTLISAALATRLAVATSSKHATKDAREMATVFADDVLIIGSYPTYDFTQGDATPPNVAAHPRRPLGYGSTQLDRLAAADGCSCLLGRLPRSAYRGNTTV